MKLFLQELKNFLIKEYYIFIIWFIALIPIIISNDIKSLVEVLLIFNFHLIADIFMAMMIWLIVSWKLLKWYIYQMYGSIIFLLIGLYSLFIHNDAIYLIPSLIYFPVVLKNIYEIKYNKEIKILNQFSILIYWILLFIFTILYFNIQEIYTIIQFMWVLFFAIVLNLRNKKVLKIGGLITIWLMILGWIIKLYYEITIDWIVNWATFSYTILPFVVFISFYKQK